MIQITIYRKPDATYKGFQVLGHADSVEEGADLVCCSVSVLAINLLNSLEAFTGEEYDFTKEEEMGLFQVTFRKTPGREADLLMRSFELGITGIADQYSDWLRVIFREV